MTEIHWTAYVAVSTGIFGAITGLAGAIMGYISYRRIARFKTQDLRLELRRHQADISDALARLPDLFKNAKNSRERIIAATGQTGAWQQWLSEFEADLSAVQVLQATFQAAPHDYHALSDVALEEILVESHRMQTKVDQYADKYRGSLAADDKERDHMRKRVL